MAYPKYLEDPEMNTFFRIWEDSFEMVVIQFRSDKNDLRLSYEHNKPGTVSPVTGKVMTKELFYQYKTNIETIYRDSTEERFLRAGVKLQELVANLK